MSSLVNNIIRLQVAHWPLMLEVPCSIPATGEKKNRCPNMLSLVSFVGMTLK